MPRLDVAILAAGLGTRMKSSKIKVLHPAGGRPLIDYVLDLAEAVSSTTPVLVVGHQRELLEQHCAGRAESAFQQEQLGTGHAVLQTENLLRKRGLDSATLLVLSGDVPLTRSETLRNLVEQHRSEGNAITVLTMKLEDPAQYGRIIRDAEGGLSSIVEARDATEAQREVSEVNAGIYLFDETFLFDALHRIEPKNVQGEYYLTDVIGLAREAGLRVGAVVAPDPMEAAGVNSRADLARVHRELVRRRVEALMQEGVTFLDPDQVSIDSQVSIGPDTVVYPFVTIEGASKIGRNCVIEPGVHLRTVMAGDHVTFKTGSVAHESTVENEASVGPYAHLRPGTILGQSVKVGNFVETKKAVFGRGAKASHLSYIGDAEVGSDVNIGAGTITCNYDGVHKHKTVIEDGVFIGSDSQLVAPVTIGRGAYVGAGSTITKDVPADALALSRVPQKVHPEWAAIRRGSKKKGD